MWGYNSCVIQSLDINNCWVILVVSLICIFSVVFNHPSSSVQPAQLYFPMFDWTQGCKFQVKDWQQKLKSDCKEIRQLRDSIPKDNGSCPCPPGGDTQQREPDHPWKHAKPPADPRRRDRAARVFQRPWAHRWEAQPNRVPLLVAHADRRPDDCQRQRAEDPWCQRPFNAKSQARHCYDWLVGQQWDFKSDFLWRFQVLPGPNLTCRWHPEESMAFNFPREGLLFCIPRWSHPILPCCKEQLEQSIV